MTYSYLGVFIMLIYLLVQCLSNSFYVLSIFHNLFLTMGTGTGNTSFRLDLKSCEVNICS